VIRIAALLASTTAFAAFATAVYCLGVALLMVDEVLRPFASLLVGIGGIGGGSDCGPGNPDVASISVASTNVSLSFFGQSTFELNAEGLDANGNAVAAPELRYNSSDELVASVSSDGTISAVAPGTATIEVCSGTFASLNVQVTVN